MRVKEIMNTSLVTIDMDDSLEVVKDIFDHSSFHHLLVTEGDKLFGIISDRDLLKVLSPYLGTPSETNRDLAILNRKAHQILTRKPITLPPTSDIKDAIAIFNQHNISCIPIIDGNYRLLGLLSWRDILNNIKISG